MIRSDELLSHGAFYKSDEMVVIATEIADGSRAIEDCEDRRAFEADATQRTAGDRREFETRPSRCALKRQKADVRRHA